MTFIEAAKYTFIENGNLPMTCKDLWEKINKNNLCQSVGKTPVATLNASLLRNSVNGETKGKRKELSFEMVENPGPAKFRLVNVKISEAKEENFMDNILEDNINIIQERILLYEIVSSEIDWKKLSIYNNNENIEYEISDCDEYTYIMWDKAHATVKIGKTSNSPISRLNQLKTANPSIELLHVFPSSLFSEQDLHSKFDAFKHDLEWFFYAKGVRCFVSLEMMKHETILKSYNKKNELNKIEEELVIFL
jgi:hypothetical protein